MNETEPKEVVVQGRLAPDGSLQLREPIDLPSGEVQVTIRPLKPVPVPREDVWTVLSRIGAAQKARGYGPRTREEIDAELNAARDEAEDRMCALERIHTECDQSRQPAHRTTEHRR